MEIGWQIRKEINKKVNIIENQYTQSGYWVSKKDAIAEMHEFAGLEAADQNDIYEYDIDGYFAKIKNKENIDLWSPKQNPKLSDSSVYILKNQQVVKYYCVKVVD